ncbi:hypothetical protein X766_15935 [Mesorhizobium sp. LSJC255A00]|uniref:hypothetical protein n=1 Tax=Mesorhizobium sp. LSJC255A00 TaxID=1287313 RepID=UPI0003CF27DB|nr:hypothetical protein [Mesorhizobium sp. LSJC255A00]ESX17883.1 hypothetical protein X766_15935 [Mesorhizobium sp. LSJC255A00]
MKIALDYDMTYSADPELFQAFGRAAKRRGHDVRIVTARNNEFDRTAPLIEAEQHFPVIYCRGIAKKWFLDHFGDGFIPDVWIDDKPESIMANSTTSVEKLADWRKTREEA